MKHEKVVQLVGAPNSGKSTLFNLLTNSTQKTGNWAGVTVQKNTGNFLIDSTKISLVDLPGISFVSLLSNSSTTTDEKVATSVLLQEKPDVIINVLDSSNIRYSLYLTLQLLEMKKSIVIALNMIDLLDQYHSINIDKLSQLLNQKITAISAKNNVGIVDLCKAIKEQYSQNKNDENHSSGNIILQYNEKLRSIVSSIVNILDYQDCKYDRIWVALKILEEGVGVIDALDLDIKKTITAQDIDDVIAQHITNLPSLNQRQDAIKCLISDARYQYIDNILANSLYKTKSGITNSISQKLDAILLHKFFGILAFIFIMYFIFSFTIFFGGAFQEFFQSISEIIFVYGTSYVLNFLSAPSSAILVLANGVGGGVVMVASFIPLIAALYFIFSALEEFGYFTRASLLVNKAMNKLHLSGGAFIPMVLGLGCNVPAIIATRTLGSREQRIISIMMIPFITCSARLSVFVLFYIIFFSKQGPYIILLLYLIGLILGLFTAHITGKMLKNVPESHFLMVLPNYQIPNMKSLFCKTISRVKDFTFGAGKLIVLVSLILHLLNAFTLNGEIVESCRKKAANGQDMKCESILITCSKSITPIFAPMGINSNNWQATVGIITGLLAKEVVVGTLNSLYSNNDEVNYENVNFHSLISKAFNDMYSKIVDLYQKASNIFNITKGFNKMSQEFLVDNDVDNSTAKKIHLMFGNNISAFAYILFVLLYFPCVSAFAAISHEIGLRWAVLSGVWSTFIAYVVATIFYQVAKYFVL